MEKRRTLTVGEFRAKLKANMEFMQGGGILEIGGHKYGCVHAGLAQDKAINEDVYMEENVHGNEAFRRFMELQQVPQPEVVEDFDPDKIIEYCALCGKKATHSQWVDGEERFICEGCVRRKYGKMANSILKQMTCLK